MDTKALVVIVNYAGWRQTLACLESVLRLEYPAFQVLVVDNGSPDDSSARIQAWARGEQACDIPPGPPGALIRPPLPKPLPLDLVDADMPLTSAHLALLPLPRNLGYAGGNNVALRHVAARQDIGYVWLLNNDTIVHPRALEALVRRLEAEPAAGMVGSTLCFLDDPGCTQALSGGFFIPWLAYSQLLGQGQPLKSAPPAEAIERRLDFILGASCLVRRAFMEHAGLLDESLFLYFEELDWARRGRPFTLAYAPDSLVYHAEGASIGATNRHPETKSVLADYSFHRNRLIMVRRHFPYALPTAVATLGFTLAKRVIRRQWKNAAAVLKAARDALTSRSGE